MQPKEAVRGTAEDVVADDNVCGHSRVVVEHQVASIRIWSLPVPPTKAGIHASVVFKKDVARPTGGAAILILEGILAVPFAERSNSALHRHSGRT